MRYRSKRTYEWSETLAYIVGLFASDGCLYNDGRHLNITSKDHGIIRAACDFLGIKTGSVPIKTSNYNGLAYHLQCSNVALYDFLLQVGLTPAKSKTLGPLNIPDAYYKDFIRGYFDGDGTIYGAWDTRWKQSLMYYTSFACASPPMLKWVSATNVRLCGMTPGSLKAGTRAYALTYAKADTRKLGSFMYHAPGVPRLSRKYAKFIAFLEADPYANKDYARVLESVDRLA